MPRTRNMKLLCRMAGEDYTAAEYEEIRRTQLLLREAEFALHNANLLWKEVITPPGPMAIVKEVVAIELGKKESLAVMGHRMVQHARHIRWEARRNLRLAYGQYASAVNRPLALKRAAKLMSGFILERLNQPSFAEQLFPVIPVGLSFTAAQLRELGGITSEQEAVLSKKWFANWSAAEQLLKDMREYAVRTGRPVITVDQAYLDSIREKEPVDEEEQAVPQAAPELGEGSR